MAMSVQASTKTLAHKRSSVCLIAIGNSSKYFLESLVMVTEFMKTAQNSLSLGCSDYFDIFEATILFGDLSFHFSVR